MLARSLRSVVATSAHSPAVSWYDHPPPARVPASGDESHDSGPSSLSRRVTPRHCHNSVTQHVGSPARPRHAGVRGGGGPGGGRRRGDREGCSRGLGPEVRHASRPHLPLREDDVTAEQNVPLHDRIHVHHYLVPRGLNNHKY